MSKKSRWKIGLLSSSYNEYNAEIRKGVLQTAELLDIDILCFFAWEPGGDGDSDLFLLRNFSYNLIRKELFDGIIIPTTSFCGNLNAEDSVRFIQNFPDIPVISIGKQIDLDNVTNVIVDNGSGIRELMVHLLRDHNLKQIGFVRGPLNNAEANERFRVYRETLLEYGIPYDDNLVVQGDFIVSSNSGGKAVTTLLDKRKYSFDALVCTTDAIARDAITELTNRGISVPADVAVTGFDNDDASQYMFPALTTVNQDVNKIGETALTVLHEILRGKSKPDTVVLPTRLVTRRSCGCFNYTGLHVLCTSDIPVSEEDAAGDGNMLQGIFSILQKDDIFTASMEGKNLNWEKAVSVLLESFLESVKNGSTDFLLDLEDAVMKGIRIGITASVWNSVISALSLCSHTDSADIKSAKMLIHGSYIITASISERAVRSGYMENVAHDFTLYNVLSSFNSCMDMETFKTIIVTKLPRTGIKSCFLFLFDENENQKVRLFAGYDEKRNRVYNADPRPIPATDITPDWLTEDDRISYYLMSLFYEKEKLGYVLFDIGLRDIKTYEKIITQFNGTLKDIRLMEKNLAYSKSLEMKVRERTKELETANERLQKLDRLKNEFIANITHDFRSPLTVILNIADLSRYDTSLNDKIHHDFYLVHAAAIRLNKSINRLLDLARMDARGPKLRISRVDPVLLLEKMYNYYCSSITATGITITKILPPQSVPYFYTDIDKFEEIIDNIFSNALKFVSPDNGRISLELVNDPDFLRITITDNGIGIRKEDLPLIFNRYEQGDAGHNSRYKGTGIGLAFAKQLAEYLNGTITVESDGPGTGSAFTVKLKKDKNFYSNDDIINAEQVTEMLLNNALMPIPDVQDSSQNGDTGVFIADRNRDNEYDLAKSVILVVDNDKAVRQIIVRYLKNFGYRNIIVTHDGKEGIEAVYQHKPDLIICDLNLPILSGDEIHDRLSENPDYNQIPFVFLSTLSDEKLALERRRKSSSVYLKKPIDRDAFSEAAGELLKKYFNYKRILYRASTDELTETCNRRFFLSQLKRELAHRTLREISLLVLDVDNFRSINEAYGHRTGDLVLSSIGAILTETLRPYDLACRYENDEFLVLLPETDINGACTAAESLQHAIRNIQLEQGGNEINLSASFGIASLLYNAPAIERELQINSIQSLYDYDNTAESDWKMKDSQIEKAGTLLIAMALRALYSAKYDFECAECGSPSIEADAVGGDRCRKYCERSVPSAGNRIKVYGT
ncbi:MAG: diguanylate cyclase [Spirochaetota bacterium]